MGHEHTTAAADGTSIAWSRTGGDGPPVVLVHGITESAASWQPVTEQLASTHDVITLDLRGHGESGRASTYDLAAMAGDVIAVVDAAAITLPHLVGHSLGGIVVSAAGAASPVGSVIDVDQSLRLGSFKEMLMPAEPMLRDPEQYGIVVDAMFESMMGDRLGAAEIARINELRRPVHEVVLGVWDLILTEPESVIDTIVDDALGAYARRDVPYLALFGIDPGSDYAEWLTARINGSTVEVWPEHGHYPHLVDPDRFVRTIEAFWAAR